MSEKTKASFEEDLARLEKIAEALESDDVTLEEAIRIYEEGVGLYKRCETSIEKARLRVEVIEAEGFAGNEAQAEEAKGSARPAGGDADGGDADGGDGNGAVGGDDGDDGDDRGGDMPF